MQPIRSSAGFAALADARRKERDALIASAREYTRRLRSELPRTRAFLYGSVARGDFNVSSDIDLLLVCDDLPVQPLDRAEFLYRFVEGREEPKGLLTREFEELAATGRLWYLDGAIEL